MQLTIQNVHSLTQDAFRSLAGDELAAGGSGGLDPADEAASITSCVHISGTWDGAVAISCSDRLARSVTESMFGMTDGEAGPADIEDAVGELVNIVGGGLKSLLPGPSVLSLPTVTGGSPMTFPGTEVMVSETFRSGAESLVVSVHRRVGEHDSTSTPNEGGNS